MIAALQRSKITSARTAMQLFAAVVAAASAANWRRHALVVRSGEKIAHNQLRQLDKQRRAA